MTALPTPESELEAAIKRLNVIASSHYNKWPVGPVTQSDLRLILTALSEARKDRERLDWLDEHINDVEVRLLSCSWMRDGLSGKMFEGFLFRDSLDQLMRKDRSASSQTEGDK